jgi:hypothetical protein
VQDDAALYYYDGSVLVDMLIDDGDVDVDAAWQAAEGRASDSGWPRRCRT